MSPTRDSDIIKPNVYTCKGECKGKRFVLADDYNGLADRYNGCREIVIEQDAAMQNAKEVIDGLNKKANKERIKFAFIGLGVGAGLVAILTLAITFAPKGQK